MTAATRTAPAVTEQAAPAGSAYDPADHTVADVLDYAQTHPDQAAAIYAAESGGRARVTLLDGLAARGAQPSPPVETSG